MQTQIMSKIGLLLFSLLALSFDVQAQTSNKKYENYTQLEKNTEECFDAWFKSKGVRWAELKASFENYFASASITNTQDPLEKQYLDILTFFEKPTKQLSTLKDKERILAILNELGLSEVDVMRKKQLDCFSNYYTSNKGKIDEKSSFYVFGESFETMKKIPDISLGLLSGAIKAAMDKNDLKKSVYQKTIILMCYFEFALFL